MSDLQNDKAGTSSQSSGTPEESIIEVDENNQDTKPSHYSDYELEPIDLIEEYSLNFNLGNVIKYVARHKDKNGLEDLKKARWYINREIENRSGE